MKASYQIFIFCLIYFIAFQTYSIYSYAGSEYNTLDRIDIKPAKSQFDENKHKLAADSIQRVETEQKRNSLDVSD